MFTARNLFRLGIALLLLAVIRALAFPIIEPFDHENPSFWLEAYNFTIMLWVPALAVLAAAAIVKVKDG
jgi:hypothetical protein